MSINSLYLSKLSWIVFERFFKFLQRKVHGLHTQGIEQALVLLNKYIYSYAGQKVSS